MIVWFCSIKIERLKKKKKKKKLGGKTYRPIMKILIYDFPTSLSYNVCPFLSLFLL